MKFVSDEANEKLYRKHLQLLLKTLIKWTGIATDALHSCHISL